MFRIITRGRRKKLVSRISILTGILLIATILGILLFDARLFSDIRDLVITGYFTFYCLILMLSRGDLYPQYKRYFKKAAAVLLVSPPCILGGVFAKKIPLFGILPQAAFFFSLTLLVLFGLTLKAIHRFLTGEMEKREAEWKKHYSLTDRETEIVELIREGLSNSKIAERLFISPKTVSNHLYAIFRKTGVKNRYELITLR